MKIKRCLVFVFIIFIIFQAKNLITNIQLSDIYYIDCDSKLSNELIGEIKDFINENLKNQKYETIFNRLKNKFPIIKSVKIQRKNPNLLLLTIKSAEPVYQVNENLVYTLDDNLFDKDSFTQESTSGLQVIFSNEKTSPELTKFIGQLPKYITDNYNIIWFNRNLIHLNDKSDDKYTVLIVHNNIPSQKILTLSKKIKVDNYADNKNKFIVDLRFSNQIVISQIKGG